MLTTKLLLPLLLTVGAPQSDEERAPSIASELEAERRGLEAFPFTSRIVEYQLENGWRFLILPRGDAPVVAFETYAGVGAADELPGETGLAHMFEHMAFKGSTRIGTTNWERERSALEEVERKRLELQYARQSDDGTRIAIAEAALDTAIADAGRYVASEEFSRILEDAGGASSLNASTSSDETRYVVSLPSNQVELWCAMEAERFADPVLREFYQEREAVLEERNMRVESNPYGKLLDALRREAFEVHPYGTPVMGYERDIRAHTAEGARRFFTTHYGARNLTTAIVGDVDPESLLPILERTCGRVPAGPEPPVVSNREPEQTAERRTRVEFPSSPLLALGFRVPELAHEDTAAVEIAVRLLGAGRSSRLERRLIRNDALATRVIATPRWPGERFPTLALFLCVPADGCALNAVLSALDEELALLAREGPSEEELATAKRAVRAELLRSMRRSEELAATLVRYSAKTGDWRNAFRRVGELERVTGDDVCRALRTYFTDARRTIATLEPKDEG